MEAKMKVDNNRNLGVQQPRLEPSVPSVCAAGKIEGMLAEALRQSIELMQETHGASQPIISYDDYNVIQDRITKELAEEVAITNSTPSDLPPLFRSYGEVIEGIMRNLEITLSVVRSMQV